MTGIPSVSIIDHFFCLRLSSKVNCSKAIQVFFSLSGAYPAVVIGAIGWVLEVPGPSVGGDSDGNLGSRVLAVVNSLADLPCINLPIICVRPETWACRGSRFVLIFSSIMSRRILYPFHCFARFPSSRILLSFVLRQQTFPDVLVSISAPHFPVLEGKAHEHFYRCGLYQSDRYLL